MNVLILAGRCMVAATADAAPAALVLLAAAALVKGLCRLWDVGTAERGAAGETAGAEVASK